MASTATYIAEWFRQRLSSAVTFQKQFVDDVTEKVKEQKAQFDRHTREANERAIQLHLDHLEEKYLCCVCGRGGEVREDDEYVYDTYSMVELPPRVTLEAAVREELADAEMTDERVKQHQRELAVRQRHGGQVTGVQPAAQMHYSDEDVGVDGDNSSFVSSSSGGSQISSNNERKMRHRRRKGKDCGQHHSGDAPRTGRRGPARDAPSRRQHGEAGDDGSGGGANESVPASPTTSTSPIATSARKGRRPTDPRENRPGELAVMDPDMVGPLEVRNTLYKIRHAVLHKEARTRRMSVAVHKDKGLMKIEESEIDMFSHFFQRPVHGYLCSACYTCARRRLDTLTQQIRGILFKAQNPLLRRVPSKEIEALTSSNQVPLVLVDSILTVQRRWANMSEEERMLLRGAEVVGAATQTPAAALAGEERTSWNAQINGETVLMGSLSEKCVRLLREEAKCGACQRRAACFFEQRSIVFLCQFCTARDRFYRENAVCINDEAMPLHLVHMLQDFAAYYQALHQQKELRGAPQSAIDQAQTDLFPLTEVMREREGLFACLAPAAAQKRSGAGEVEAAYSAADAQSTAARAAEVPVAAPSTFAAVNRVGNTARVSLSEQRERVGRTMVTLFDGVKIESTGINLFADAEAAKTAAPVSPAASIAVVAPPASMPEDTGTTDLFDFFAPNAASAASNTPAPLIDSAEGRRNGSAAMNWTSGAPVGQTQSFTPPPNGIGTSNTPNPDWEGLF
ncbi:hypothetical protein ABB37_00413 [Leptomonas pyrrhocoris]|uniref:Uncharacterized protein n=1 Tax=Leptomonas pyrrhocoris TaxID=157538 RepID=A0A0N1J5G6_LEPPY|nr:hypothetical protein ABB37_00413 [Leptomonas pyrrhocoris]KPA86164.1 hypothetical protein ABB37_00413 [Leptomonas pyrrhocoris]|eukprot:XP_015664603.1 hypothetical protein ABB37_00413 [Leptomonas pyrrhocoris]